jgi:biopolymer transport protein ExbB/TolQ
MGRLLRGRESQKTCLNIKHNLRGREVPCLGLEDKKGKSPDRLISVRVFFWAPDPNYNEWVLTNEKKIKRGPKLNIDALLKTFIYLIASSLFYPVLFLLSLLTVLILVYSGSFFAEWLERVRLKKYAPEDLPGIIKDGKDFSGLSHRVRNYIKNLETLIQDLNQRSEIEIENLIQENTLRLWKSMDRLRMLVRIAPALGLIGTLIPMGTGLAALGQGDMTRLSSDLVIAFTTTVVGLALGIFAFFFYTVKRRWVEEDIKNMELATELLTDNLLEKLLIE